MSAYHLAYVGLGSNLQQPEQQVMAALTALAEIRQTTRVAQSQLYATPPMGPQDQPDFVNAVAALQTSLGLQAFFRELRALESNMGRRRDGQRWGPRIIDIDLLLFDDLQYCDADLSVPHPGLHERDFVLVPLAEIAPELNVPGRGPLSDLLAALTSLNVTPLDTTAPVS